MWIWVKLYFIDIFLFVEHSFIYLPLNRREKFYVFKRSLSLGLLYPSFGLKYNIKASEKQKVYQT